MASSSSTEYALGRLMRIATSRAAVSPVSHSRPASSWSVLRPLATARSWVRFTPWSSPWRSLTARIFGSSSAASRASTSSTVAWGSTPVATPSPCASSVSASEPTSGAVPPVRNGSRTRLAIGGGPVEQHRASGAHVVHRALHGAHEDQSPVRRHDPRPLASTSSPPGPDRPQHVVVGAGGPERRDRSGTCRTRLSWTSARRSTSTWTARDWRVNANANQGYSLGGLILQTAGKVVGQLLAAATSTRPTVGRGAPRGRPAHPRPRHALRLLRRLVAADAAAARASTGCPGKVDAAAAAALRVGRRADRQLPRHHAERVGGRAGVQLVRHVHGAVRAARRPDVRAGPAGRSRSSSTTSTCRPGGARRRRSPT